MDRAGVPPAGCVLSARGRAKLTALQASVHRLSVRRSAALRLLSVSRWVATVHSQQAFWLEFASADRDYRLAVQRLTAFCIEHRQGPRRGRRALTVLACLDRAPGP